MKTVVFDIETKNFFSDVASNNPVDLDMSVLCLWDSETDQVQAFLEKDFEKLWPILKNADLFVTYNGDHFDIPIVQKYCPFDLSRIKSLDLLVEIKKSLGKRLKLNSIAESTLGEGKSASGMDAVAWWNSGEITKLVDYCKRDVIVTKKIYEFAKKNGFLYYGDHSSGERAKIPLDTSSWESKKQATDGMLF